MAYVAQTILNTAHLHTRKWHAYNLFMEQWNFLYCIYSEKVTVIISRGNFLFNMIYTTRDKRSRIGSAKPMPAYAFKTRLLRSGIGQCFPLIWHPLHNRILLQNVALCSTAGLHPSKCFCQLGGYRNEIKNTHIKIQRVNEWYAGTFKLISPAM